MKLSRLAFAVMLTIPAGAALARPNPTPPPSGIVVHLFGPGSITSGVLPSFAGPAGGPRPGLPAAANRPLSGAAAVGNGTSTGASSQPRTVVESVGASGSAYPEPTMGDVLHQMFVVGDPSKTPGQMMAPGRSAEHPLAVNP